MPPRAAPRAVGIGPSRRARRLLLRTLPMSDDDRPDIPPPRPQAAPEAAAACWRSCSPSLLLGLVSFVFGMFMAVASDLPSLTQLLAAQERHRARCCSTTSATRSASLSQQNRVIVTPEQIPQIVKEAVISIEDKRF